MKEAFLEFLDKEKNKLSFNGGVFLSFVLHLVLFIIALVALERTKDNSAQASQVFTVTLEGGEKLGGISQVPKKGKEKLKVGSKQESKSKVATKAVEAKKKKAEKKKTEQKELEFKKKEAKKKIEKKKAEKKKAEKKKAAKKKLEAKKKAELKKKKLAEKKKAAKKKAEEKKAKEEIAKKKEEIKKNDYLYV